MPALDSFGSGCSRTTVYGARERSRGKPARMRVWHPRAPVLRFARPSPFTVGRGPVPRRASIGETALVCMRFSRGSNDRGGQAPVLRFARPSPFTVGRGPVPRRASIERETAWVGVRFSRRSNDRGGQAPALRLVRCSRALAVETRSPARVAGEGLRATGTPSPRGLSYRTHRNMKHPRLCTSQILTTSTSPVSNERFAARVTASVFTASA